MPDLTKEELSELKDEIEQFKGSRVWRHILTYMQEMYMTAAEEALNAEDIKQTKFAKGIAHTVKMVSEFDEHITLFKRASEVK